MDINELTIDVSPYRYGEIELRIYETGKYYDCQIWIEKGVVECLLGDVPTKNREEHEQLEKRVIAAVLEECPTIIENFNDFVEDECDGDYDYAIEILTKRNGNVESGSYSNYNKRIKRNIEASPKDMFAYESLRKKYDKKNHLNEMSIENFNTRIAKDFVRMVLQYIDDEPDVISTGEFNYGEYDNWVRSYPELADLCMVGGNQISDAADELLESIFKFIRVAQRNTITTTHRREFKENDVEVVKEGVGMQNIIIKKYKNDIENFLNDYKWETIKPMDVVVEFEYGDEYYMLVQEIMDYLGIDDSNPEYDAIYYGVGSIIRNHLRKMKVWR